MLLTFAAPAAAAERTPFAIPAGRLDESLIKLGEQAGISIGLSAPGIAARHARNVSGALTLDQALSKLLDGSGFIATRIDGHSIRIDRAPAKKDRKRAVAMQSANPSEPEEIIVSASKRGTSLDRLPGAATVVSLSRNDLSPTTRGTKTIVDALPIVASTNFGPGRNKLFIRGIADSSFNGPTQATVGQYLGDIRLSYNAPDPNLTLFDMGSVEILEGPQGTLYGAGSLAGLIRLIPNAPNFASVSAAVETGVTALQGGGAGYDGAGMVNLPLGQSAAARVVAYRSLDGGYIDDPGRGLKNLNRTTITGGRAALRVRPGPGWTIDLGAVVQNTKTPDSQYAVNGTSRMARQSTISQPFDNDFRLGEVTIRKAWGSGLSLVSATGVVNHRVDTTFDATGFRRTMGPLSYQEHNRILLISHETRVARDLGDGAGWVAGVGMIADRDRAGRLLGPPDDPIEITGVTNRTTEISAFGEATLALTHRLNVTSGARLGYARMEGEPIAPRGAPRFDPSQTQVRVLPTFAFSWRAFGGIDVFGRYQQGFRAGGLGVARGIATLDRFKPDRLEMVESGVRLGRAGDTLSATVVGSYARWTNIQADLVANSGLPYTANIGDGRVYGLEATADWRPVTALAATAALFFDDSALTKPAPAFVRAQASALPNNADLGARAALTYSTKLSGTLGLVITGSGRYVSRSRLDVGTMLHFAQGNYAEFSAGVHLEAERWSILLDAANIGDSHANSFAVGNPFSVTRGDQVTPLRPRAIRLGMRASF